MFGISGKHNNVSLASENPYQDIPESENSNTYEDLPTVQHVNLDSPGIKPNKDVLNNPQTNLATEENNTYEVLLTIPQTNLSTQENNTYEDIPASQSNTYASVEELNTQGSQGKKIHKWWKFKPEGKKK
ncbi:uncharacterized protein sh2d7 [Hoplias malabaricus]|uniref:uncharacterized protein sh2d7 n=1 Tax=Hoplias malabaricus TaxID=27720 RepID=UPI0034617F4A